MSESLTRTRWPALLGAGMVAAGALAYAATEVPEATPFQPPERAQGAIPASFADLAERVRPAVVHIATEAVQPVVGRLPGMPGRRGLPFAPPGERRLHGVGSGFIIDPDGLVVTNHHVVDGAESVQVTLEDGTTHEAEVLGTDPKTDLALLRIETSQPLPSVRFGDSERTRVGDWVVAVGSPFGLGGSLSAGVVSARGRDIRSGPYDDYLQFDAPINRGNSGGPLFNVRGEVIGVNTAIFSPSGGNVGIGFAVPAAIAVPVVAALGESGHVDRGWIGIRIQDVTPDLAASLSLEKPRGALVAGVEAGGPAEDAGVRPGDVILSVAGEPVEDTRDAARAIGVQPAGNEVELEIWRDGEPADLTVTLGRPDAVARAGHEARASEPGEARPRLGVRLSELNDRARARFGIDEGAAGALIVGVAPRSPAARSRLRPGDVIVGVDANPVEGPGDVVDALAARDRGEDRPVLLRVERDGARRYIAVPLG